MLSFDTFDTVVLSVVGLQEQIHLIQDDLDSANAGVWRSEEKWARFRVTLSFFQDSLRVIEYLWRDRPEGDENEYAPLLATANWGVLRDSMSVPQGDANVGIGELCTLQKQDVQGACLQSLRLSLEGVFFYHTVVRARPVYYVKRVLLLAATVAVIALASGAFAVALVGGIFPLVAAVHTVAVATLFAARKYEASRQYICSAG